MKRLLNYIRFINEELRIEQMSPENIHELKTSLQDKFIQYRDEIISNILVKPNGEIKYIDESIFTFSNVLSELESQFGKDVVIDLNLKPFLIKISQILDFQRKDTKRLIQREFDDYIADLDDRISVISKGGVEAQHFDIEEGEASLIKASVYNPEEEELQDDPCGCFSK